METARFLGKTRQDPGRDGSLVSATSRGGRRCIPLFAKTFWEPEFEGSDLNFAGWAKKLTGAKTISVGSVGLAGDFIESFGGQGSYVAGLEELVRRMEKEEFDIIAVGRAILADPKWVQKVRTGDRTDLQDFDPSSMATLY